MTPAQDYLWPWRVTSFSERHFSERHSSWSQSTQQMVILWSLFSLLYQSLSLVVLNWVWGAQSFFAVERTALPENRCYLPSLALKLDSLVPEPLQNPGKKSVPATIIYIWCFRRSLSSSGLWRHIDSSCLPYAQFWSSGTQEGICRLLLFNQPRLEQKVAITVAQREETTNEFTASCNPQCAHCDCDTCDYNVEEDDADTKA